MAVPFGQVLAFGDQGQRTARLGAVGIGGQHAPAEAKLRQVRGKVGLGVAEGGAHGAVALFPPGAHVGIETEGVALRVGVRKRGLVVSHGAVVLRFAVLLVGVGQLGQAKLTAQRLDLAGALVVENQELPGLPAGAGLADPAQGAKVNVVSGGHLGRF